VARHKGGNGQVYDYRVINFIVTPHLDKLLGALAGVLRCNRSQVLRRVVLEEAQRRHIEVDDGNRNGRADRGASETHGDG
jgi:hypothetical protein